MEFEPFFLPPTRHRLPLKASREIDHAPVGGGANTAIAPTAGENFMAWIWAIIFLALIVLTARLGYLQTVVGQTYRDRAEQNRIRLQVIPAPRGQILDRTGQPLVNNVPNYVLTVIPADIPRQDPERATTLATLASASGKTIIEIETLLDDPAQRPTDPLALVEYAEQRQAFMWLAAVQNIPAAGLQVLPTREYVDGNATAAIVGYIGKVSSKELAANPQLTTLSVTGKTGLERVYNDILTGRDGEREVERDVKNRQQRVVNEVDPEPGNTIHLGIDAGLQQRAAEALKKTVERLQSPGGAVVAMDPRDGQILALASAPSYDNNWFVQPNHAAEITTALTDSRKLLLNRAVAGQYPSGSIVKPLISAAGLEEKIVTPATTVLSVGGFTVGVNRFPDWKAGGHGVTNLAKALAESVNTYYYILGGGFEQRPGLGVDRIVTYLQRFGWGSRLGVDVPSEAPGFLPSKDWRENQRPTPWRLGDTYHLSIGQGDLEVTPIQVAAAMSAIANNGILYQPRLATRVTRPDGTTVREFPKKVLAENIASAANLRAVQNGLREGVLSGSSRSLQSLPVAAAGKTGTAQFGSGDATHSWYSAYAPYENPEIVVAVIVEAGGEGNAAALPIAKELFEYYFRATKAVAPVDNPLTDQ